MGFSDFVQRVKLRKAERECKRADLATAELARLTEERKSLEIKNKVYLQRDEERSKVAKLKKDILVAKINNNPLGRTGLKMAKKIKKHAQEKQKDNNGMSFLPKGSDHPWFKD